MNPSYFSVNASVFTRFLSRRGGNGPNAAVPQER
jgi:hypothetical protein